MGIPQRVHGGAHNKSGGFPRRSITSSSIQSSCDSPTQAAYIYFSTLPMWCTRPTNNINSTYTINDIFSDGVGNVLDFSWSDDEDDLDSSINPKQPNHIPPFPKLANNPNISPTIFVFPKGEIGRGRGRMNKSNRGDIGYGGEGFGGG